MLTSLSLKNEKRNQKPKAKQNYNRKQLLLEEGWNRENVIEREAIFYLNIPILNLTLITFNILHNYIRKFNFKISIPIMEKFDKIGEI